jgi:hypothetical protein
MLSKRREERESLQWTGQHSTSTSPHSSFRSSYLMSLRSESGSMGCVSKWKSATAELSPSHRQQKHHSITHTVGGHGWEGMLLSTSPTVGMRTCHRRRLMVRRRVVHCSPLHSADTSILERCSSFRPRRCIPRCWKPAAGTRTQYHGKTSNHQNSGPRGYRKMAINANNNSVHHASCSSRFCSPVTSPVAFPNYLLSLTRRALPTPR